MSIPYIYNRTRLLLVSPVPAWEEILAESLGRRKVVRKFLLPWSLFLGLCTLLGVLFSERISDSNAFTYIVINGTFSFFTIFLEVYISGWIITELTALMKNDTTSQRVFNLVIYSHVPFFLVLALTHLFPQLLFLNLFGAYSFFLFWSGIDKMTEIEPENKLPFLLSSSLIMISLFFLLNFIFNNIYDTILGQLSIFAGL